MSRHVEATTRTAEFSDHSERVFEAYYDDGVFAGATYELLESELTDEELAAFEAEDNALAAFEAEDMAAYPEFYAELDNA